MTRGESVHRGHRRAFTLIESMAAVVVLGSLAGVSSLLIFNAVDGYTEAATAAQLHVEASIALDRAIREIRKLKIIFTFLVGYWLYIDGVDTVIRMAVDYGMSLGFNAGDLIVALLITQFVGFPAAIAFGKLGERIGARRGSAVGRRVRRRDRLVEHVLGKGDGDRAGPAGDRAVERLRDELRHPLRPVDLDDRLAHFAVEAAVVDLLEGLAILLVARHLADEDDHRRGVLAGRVHADRRVARPRAARDHEHARRSRSDGRDGAPLAQIGRSALGKLRQTGTPQKCSPSVQVGVTRPARRTHGGPMCAARRG